MNSDADMAVSRHDILSPDGLMSGLGRLFDHFVSGTVVFTMVSTADGVCTLDLTLS